MDMRTERLVFREMTNSDVDAMAQLLSDPRVMTYYPRPKTRDEAQRWIHWNQANYGDYGFGLCILEMHDGRFVGDCGLTVQEVDGQQEVEIGYHVCFESQHLGLATEAAKAVRQYALDHEISRLIAIINPENVPSRRVAEKIGLRYERTASVFGHDHSIYAAELASSPSKWGP